jgi:hypothetical protein
MLPYLMGFDIMGYYIPGVNNWIANGILVQGTTTDISLLGNAPLFYLILIGINSFGLEFSLILKVLPSILHGVLASLIYFYARKTLDWSEKKSLCVSLLGTLYFVALRVSWDLLRNQLALSFFFLTLIFLNKAKKNVKHFFELSGIMILIVLTHQLLTVIMLFIFMVTIAQKILENKLESVKEITLSSIPSTLLFLYITYLNFNVEPDVNWLTHFGFLSYQHMVLTMLNFIIFCFWPLIIFVVKGFTNLKNLHLRTWVIVCLFLSFIPIMEGIQWRWVLLLTYPFAFFTVDALSNLRFGIKLRNLKLYILSIFTIIVVVFSAGFMVMPNTNPFPYFSSAAWPMQKYIPSSMLQNTIALEDCPDTENALNWISSNISNNSLLITHTAFYGWALLTLHSNQIKHYGWGNPTEAALDAKKMEYDKVYTIWWVRGYGWTPYMPEEFQMIYNSNRIAIYEYQ